MEKDLLLADLGYLGEALRHNEDVGEKRFSFFVALVTAVVTGLVALATSEDLAGRIDFRRTAGAALGGLLVVGLLSYLRMLKRNLTTDKYIDALDYIRARYVALYFADKEYELPLKKGAVERRLPGGYAETFGVIEGVLAAGLVHVYFQQPLSWALAVGTLIAAALCYLNLALRR